MNIRKPLILAALAALPSLAAADVVLYGKIGGGVDVGKVKNTPGTTTRIVDYGSYIGFKGQEDLNGDLKAIWQIEQAVNIGGVGSSFNTRDSFVGLSGSFGTVKAGYQKHPYGEAREKLDIWEYAGKGTYDNSTSAGLYRLGTYGRGVGLSYETPAFNGFSVKAAVVPSDNNPVLTDRDDAGYSLRASYNNNGWFADVAGLYLKHVGLNGQDYWEALAQGGYQGDRWMAGLAYAYNRDDPNSDAPSGFERYHDLTLSGRFNPTEALALKASLRSEFGKKDSVSGQKLRGNGRHYHGIVGADYALSKRTVANAQFGYQAIGSGAQKYTRYNATVGMTHRF